MRRWLQIIVSALAMGIGYNFADDIKAFFKGQLEPAAVAVPAPEPAVTLPERQTQLRPKIAVKPPELQPAKAQTTHCNQ